MLLHKKILYILLIVHQFTWNYCFRSSNYFKNHQDINCLFISSKTAEQKQHKPLISLLVGVLVSFGQVGLFPEVSYGLQVDFVPTRGFQTKTGLKYFEIDEINEGNTPLYGQIVAFNYNMYFRKSSDSKLDLIDKTEDGQPFVHKHGNGRIIRGVEEALHTMKEGSKRRIIVPKSIGYDEPGLGPIPAGFMERRKLGNLLDNVEADKGELVFDLELVKIRDDEADQGYYDDIPISQDEVRQLVIKSLELQKNPDQLKR